MRRVVRRHRGLVVAIACGMTGTLAGCGGTSDAAVADSPGGALTIVVGAHSNAPRPSLDGAAGSARDLALQQGARLAMVVADGAPFQQDLSPLLAAGAADVPEQQRPLSPRAIDDAVAGARARSPESDLLAALTLAGKSLGGQRGLRTLVVLDSGLSTAGVVNFTEPGMLDADPQDVATFLANSRLLPNLTGVSVVFEGIGETAAPQQPLGRARRTRLESIWTAVVKKAGAETVQIERPPSANPPAADLPPVTPVTVGTGYVCSPGQMVLTGGGLGFQPGSGKFQDPAAALEALRPIIEQVRDAGIPTDMFGTDAAVGDPPERRKRSEERAQTVANLFIALGMPMSELRVEGQGSNFDGYVNDRDSLDRVLPAAAAQNRKVILKFARPVRCP